MCGLVDSKSLQENQCVNVVYRLWSYLICGDWRGCYEWSDWRLGDHAVCGDAVRWGVESARYTNTCTPSVGSFEGVSLQKESLKRWHSSVFTLSKMNNIHFPWMLNLPRDKYQAELTAFGNVSCLCLFKFVYLHRLMSHPICGCLTSLFFPIATLLRQDFIYHCVPRTDIFHLQAPLLGCIDWLVWKLRNGAWGKKRCLPPES